MATLEKIRSKSVLLLIIIGVALLAFIVGDFFTSGRAFFGTGTTVAQVGSQKIDIQDFQREMERANQRVQQSGQKVESAMLQQQVLDGMISERLFKQELQKLGIVVTDKELSEKMVGAGSELVNSLVQSQVGVESAAQLHDMAFNPTKYNIPQETAAQLQDYWMSLEKQTEQFLLQEKFNNLFNGTIQANELDAKALYDENNSTVHVAYARKLFTSVPDDEKYNATDDEVQKEWAAHKKRYALDYQMRTIDYINVTIAPSAEDIANGEKLVEKALEALRNSEGTEGIAEMTDFVADRKKTTVASIRDKRIQAFADSANVGAVKMISRTGNNFTLAKLFNRSLDVDSANIDVIIVEGGKATVDSVLTALRGGLKIDSLGRFQAVRGAQDSVWVSMVDPNISNIKQSLENAQLGTYFVTDTTNTQGAQIVRVNSRKAPVKVAEYAVIDYVIDPSAATINTLEAKLQDYIKANPTAAEFAANATAAGYHVIPTRITEVTPGITGVPDSRDVVAWAMKAKKGKVSPIFGSQTTGHFVAAALTDIYNDYIPATDSQVKAALSAQIANDKKAAELIENYKGKAKDLAGYAQLMDAKVDSATVTFGQINVFNPGFAGAKVAAVASVTPKGTLTQPLQANNGVVVMQIVDVENGNRPYDFKESAALFDRLRGAGVLTSQFNNLLIGNKKVKNNLLKFFQN